MKKLLIFLFVIGYSNIANAYPIGFYYDFSTGVGTSLNTHSNTNSPYEDRYANWVFENHLSPIGIGMFTRFFSSEFSISISMRMPADDLFSNNIRSALRLSLEYDYEFDSKLVAGTSCFFQQSLEDNSKGSSSSRLGFNGMIGLNIGDSNFQLRPFLYIGLDGGTEETTLKYGLNMGLGLRAYFILGD